MSPHRAGDLRRQELSSMDNRLVYVVDDDPDMLRSAAFLLQSMGYRFECFPDGADFLAALPRLQPGQAWIQGPAQSRARGRRPDPIFGSPA